MVHSPTTLRSLALGLCLFACAPLVGCGGGTQTPADAPSGGGEGVAVGKAAPELKVEKVTGSGPASLAEGKGKVVIVDFWATFCEPCRKSFPAYEELAKKYGDDLAIIAVSVDDPEDVSNDDVKGFAEELGVSFSVLWDKTGGTAKTYDPPKMPTSYVLDKEGVIRHIHAGYESGEASKIDEEVAALLK
ncbi:MAG: TlpA disulfide reductase family protein [Polyangiaceae bacterium]